jgi:glycosyltransferase involved in cell wall biosynthesis
VLSYIGSLGTWYLTNEMLHFFSLLKKQISNAKFLIITQDNPEIILKNLHLFEINEEDIIIKSCSRNELPNIAHSSDFSIFFIKPSYSKKASSPTKMGELLAMGIPIICNNNVGDVEEIIRLTKGGICIETLNDDAFKNTINQMLIFKNSPKDTRVLSEKYFLLENGVRQYIECYKSISV